MVSQVCKSEGSFMNNRSMDTGIYCYVWIYWQYLGKPATTIYVDYEWIHPQLQSQSNSSTASQEAFQSA